MTRLRRSAPEARQLILDAAERQLAHRGPAGVRVQDVAQELGVTPSTILYHFASREHLLAELMTHGARKLRERVTDLVGRAQPDLAALAHELADLYGSHGYASLYATLWNAGQQPPASRGGVFEPLLERLCASRSLGTRSRPELAANAILALNLIAFAEALVGTPMRQAVNLPDDAEARAQFRRWLSALLDKGVESA